MYGGKVELHIIDNKSDSEEVEEEIENSQIEAKIIAKKIKNILESNYQVYDKKIENYRKATYKDFVILLRTTANVALNYERELTNNGFPTYSDVSSSYLEEIEVQIILSVLKIIDNPNNDIELITVLRSIIGNFNDNELLEIRLNSKNNSYYFALKEAINISNEQIKNKVNNFFNMLNRWQEIQEYYRLDELIWDIYESTGFYDYISTMQNGELKTANLKKLFEIAKEYEKTSFKGLYNFINYINKISKKGSDNSSAKIIGENDDVIKIMSIHKSKGLEFPIVFLAGTGKQFNMQDLNKKIVLHQDIGIRNAIYKL